MNHPSADDAFQIHNLYARYAWALDTGDTEGYVALFAPDAVVYETRDDGLAEARGHEQIRAFITRFHANPELVIRQHHSTERAILPDPDGRADRWLCRAYAVATDVQPGSHPIVHWCGYTTDIVVKIDGEWLIESRTISPWGTGTAAGS